LVPVQAGDDPATAFSPVAGASHEGKPCTGVVADQLPLCARVHAGRLDDQDPRAELFMVPDDQQPATRTKHERDRRSGILAEDRVPRRVPADDREPIRVEKFYASIVASG
jgi:hypothetical protein